MAVAGIVVVIVATAFPASPPASPQSRPESRWSAETQRKHLLARDGCRQAQALGLTPAYRGQPGYWEEWDGDNDGISCERW